MKRNVNKTKKNDMDAKGRIGPDQPFQYEAVAAATGPEYVRHLGRDGLVSVPYEEVKKNMPGFYLPEDKCVWMRAGVINFRLCDYDYDCYHCPFDQAMVKAMGDKDALNKKEKAANWARHVKTRYRIATTPCIHFLSGRIASPEECSGDYRCHHCDVHKLLNEESPMKITDQPARKNVSGYKMMDDYYYYFGHSWVNIEKFGRVRVGIDDFISKILGPVDEINLPPVGTGMKRAGIGCILTRKDKKAPLQSPMSGTVCAVNEKVKKNPELVRDDPYREGWLYMLDSENFKPELSGLYFGRECFQWMEKECQHLHALMGPRYEHLSATGGDPVDDILGEFPEISWNLLLKTFFHTTEQR